MGHSYTMFQKIISRTQILSPFCGALKGCFKTSCTGRDILIVLGHSEDISGLLGSYVTVLSPLT